MCHDGEVMNAWAEISFGKSVDVGMRMAFDFFSLLFFRLLLVLSTLRNGTFTQSDAGEQGSGFRDARDSSVTLV